MCDSARSLMVVFIACVPPVWELMEISARAWPKSTALRLRKTAIENRKVLNVNLVLHLPFPGTFLKMPTELTIRGLIVSADSAFMVTDLYYQAG